MIAFSAQQAVYTALKQLTVVIDKQKKLSRTKGE